MKIWNFVAFGQVYHQPAMLEEGRHYFDQWLDHVSRYGNREYDSPTYCGVDLESLLLMYRFTTDADIKSKAKDALTFYSMTLQHIITRWLAFWPAPIAAITTGYSAGTCWKKIYESPAGARQ